MQKKRLALILSFVMILTMVPISSFGSDFTDMPNDLSKPALERAISNNLLKGDNDKIRPGESLKRAEMATIVNRAFNAIDKASLSSFTDVSSEKWYYEEMAKAVKMETFVGNGGKLNPEANITREEAFVVLARAFKISGNDQVVLDGFLDKDRISDWAKDEVAGLVKLGYVAGSNGQVNPKNNITRAEFAQIMDNLIKTYITIEGEYTKDLSGNVMVNKEGVVLKGLTITGDLIIGDGVGDGEVTLEDTTVTGRVLVRGGGEDSIKIIGNSNVKNIIIARVDGKVRIFTQDGAQVGEVVIDGNDDVVLEGKFDSVTIASDNLDVQAKSADIKSASLVGIDSKIIVDKNSSIDKVTVNAKGAKIDGEGKVKEVAVNANNVTINTKDTKVNASKDIKGLVIKDEVKKEEDKKPISGGGGSSGGSGNEVVKVSAISVTGAEGVVKDGTLQMATSVSPSTASNKSVTWSVATLNGGAATIDQNGLLTATSVGTVTVTATAKDGSGKSGSKVVTIADVMVTTSEELTTALSGESENKVILVSGALGSGDANGAENGYTVYTIDKENVIVRGMDGAKVYGTFIVKKDATIDNLEILNKGGNAHPHKNAINIVGRKATITNNTFTMNLSNDVANGIVVWATGTGDANLNITGNTFDGYVGNDGTYASSAFLVIEGLAVNSAIDTSTPMTNAITISEEEDMALANTYNNCYIPYEHVRYDNGKPRIKLTLCENAEKLEEITKTSTPETYYTMDDQGTILVRGTIGASDDYTAYDITKPISIKGVENAKIYGSFIIKTDGVTVDGLTMYTKGGGNGPLKAAIDVIAKQVTITNNKFELNNPERLTGENEVGNGVTIWPNGSAEPNYNISGNHFKSYMTPSQTWSSTAFQIAEGVELSRFGMNGTTSSVVDLSAEVEASLATGNTYENSYNNYLHINWTGGMTYKYVLASTPVQFLGIGYAGEGATILLANDISLSYIGETQVKNHITIKGNHTVTTGDKYSINVLEGKTLTIAEGTTITGNITGAGTWTGKTVEQTLDNFIASIDKTVPENFIYEYNNQTITLPSSTKIDAIQGTGSMVEMVAMIDAMDEEEIKVTKIGDIDVNYGQDGKVTKPGQLQIDVKTKFIELMKSAAGNNDDSTIADLDGKSIKITVELSKGEVARDITFTIVFDIGDILLTEVNTSSL